ncbi:MAG: Gfo/Idh/MocA family oxidoreductase [Planctomycetota bacterium]
MSFRIGIGGCGQFARCFVPLFKAHPDVSGVCVADALPARADEFAQRFGVEAVDDFETMLGSSVDAVAIMTQRWTHAPMAIRAMQAGKHVYSAVPAATTVDEMSALVATVTETGRTYMLGETSYYYPATVWCRQRFGEGAFGDFVYGEGEYLHDMSHGFYEAFQYSGGERWKRDAGYPPMLYPTHSVSIVLSVTGARVTDVACFGIRDRHEDGVFGENANDWDNPFSNQSALMRTSDGGVLRVNEFRRVGYSRGRSVRLSLLGTRGSFEEQAGSAVFTTLDHNREDLTNTLACTKVEVHDAMDPAIHEALRDDFEAGFAKAHAQERGRLPDSFRGMPNGHEGSHQFLVDDFCRAVTTGTLPPNHVWAAARYNLPGIVAHESSLSHGKTLAVPDLGWPESTPSNARSN